MREAFNGDESVGVQPESLQGSVWLQVFNFTKAREVKVKAVVELGCFVAIVLSASDCELGVGWGLG
jgi:hypothetical protein